MKFAYADPPYPGQAKRWYGGGKVPGAMRHTRIHPDYKGEVDHFELIELLEDQYPDGWALSTSAAALQIILHLCPPGVRIGVWNRPNSTPPGHRGRGSDIGTWHWTWEPVIIKPGRPPSILTRDLLTWPKPAGVIPGQKPPQFTRWVWTLLGAIEGDTVDDLFPGSGAVSTELAQGVLL